MLIFIDPGHGGRDPGAVHNGLREKDLTLRMGLLIGQTLAARYVCKVAYSRTSDVFFPLGHRTRMANDQGADFFLSLHHNAFGTPGPNGYEDFTRVNPDYKTELTRTIFHRHTAKVWIDEGRADRGRRYKNFAVLRTALMPAVLAENGFLSNARDAELLRNPAFFSEMVAAHVSGIAEAMNLLIKKKGVEKHV